MAEFSIRPEFRDLLPKLATDERAKLAENIQANGVREPLSVWLEEKVLIDGHNRFAICSELNLPYRTIEYSFKSADAAKLWMLNNQLGRRNLTDAARVQMCLLMKPVIEAMMKANQIAGAVKGGKSKVHQNSDEPKEDATATQTVKEIAKLAGVSHDTVHRVEKVLKSNDETTKTGMLSGEISINKAYETIRAPKPAPQPGEREPLTEKELLGWVVLSKDLFGGMKDYVRKCPLLRTTVIRDLKELVKFFEDKEKNTQ